MGGFGAASSAAFVALTPREPAHDPTEMKTTADGESKLPVVIRLQPMRVTASLAPHLPACAVKTGKSLTREVGGIKAVPSGHAQYARVARDCAISYAGQP